MCRRLEPWHGTLCRDLSVLAESSGGSREVHGLSSSLVQEMLGRAGDTDKLRPKRLC